MRVGLTDRCMLFRGILETFVVERILKLPTQILLEA